MSTINDLYTCAAKLGFHVFPGDMGLLYHPTEGLLFRLKEVPYTRVKDGKIGWTYISAGFGPEKPFDVIYELMTRTKPTEPLRPADGDWSNIKWENIDPPTFQHRVRA